MDDNQEEEELRRAHAYLPYMGGRARAGMGVHGECIVRLGKWLWAYGGEDGSGRRGRVIQRGCGLPER